MSPPLPLTRSGNEEEDDGPGGSALEHNYQPTLDRAYCEGIPPRTGPQGQGGLRPADPYQAWAPVRISPRYLHVILTVLKSTYVTSPFTSNASLVDIDMCPHRFRGCGDV